VAAQSCQTWLRCVVAVELNEFMSNGVFNYMAGLTHDFRENLGFERRTHCRLQHFGAKVALYLAISFAFEFRIGFREHRITRFSFPIDCGDSVVFLRHFYCLVLDFVRVLVPQSILLHIGVELRHNPRHDLLIEFALHARWHQVEVLQVLEGNLTQTFSEFLCFNARHMLHVCCLLL